MAILGFFKKDKSKASSSQASTPTACADDADSAEGYVLSPPSIALPSNGNGDDGYTSSSASFVSAASSKKIRLPFSKRASPQSSSPLSHSLQPPRNHYDGSTDKLSLNINTYFDTPSLQPSLFLSAVDLNSIPTLPPEQDSNATPQPVPLQKTDPASDKKSSGRLFSWRERKKSKPTKPDFESLVLPPLSDDSFNLKSFRHVLPEPQATSPQKGSPLSASSSSLLPPARPRGASVTSADSSQRISVAAFREAQARRRSGSPSPIIRPLSVANSAISDVVPTTATRPGPGRSPASIAWTSPKPGHATKPKPKPRRSTLYSSSEATSSEESESEEGSPSRSRSRLSRQRTITRRSYGARTDVGHGAAARSTDHSRHQQATSTRSEMGHGPGSPSLTSHAPPSPRGPPPSSFPRPITESFAGTRSFSLYRRQRASYSTSELKPNAAARRASAVVEANKREQAAGRRQHERGGDSDTSESGSESDSSDDAPLSALKIPPRPGSALSNRSGGSSGFVRKPLIDLNTKANPLSGKPIKEEVPGRPSRERHPTLLSPTDINSRLSQLTNAAGLQQPRGNPHSKSELNLPSKSILRPSFTDEAAAKPDSPASTSTIIAPVCTESPKPIINPGPRRSSFSAVSIMSDASQVQDRRGGLRPVPIKDRSDRDTGFKVVSRPQKSASALSSSSIDSASQRSPVESPPPSHRRQSSSSTSFTVATRPQSSVPPLTTRPLVASAQNANSASGSGSSASATTSSSASVFSRSSQPMSMAMQQKSPTLQRPFAFGVKRQESPASSTGGSSNGKGPLTPLDGTDYFSPDVRGSGDSPASSTVGATPPSAMKGTRAHAHARRVSVSFQEPLGMEKDKDETVRGRKSSFGQSRPQETNTNVVKRESKLKERRRSEAKAAIELANVINGHSPLETEDSNDEAPRIPPLSTGGSMGLDFSKMSMGAWQQQQGMGTPMMSGMPNMGSMGGMNGMPGMGMNVGLNPAQFMVPPPPPGVDAAYLVAHQQAMRIAKQAYQYAVAQQAMAQAADEWERGSSVSAFAGPSPAGVGMGGMGMGVGGYGGMPGMNNVWGASMSMFPSAPRSVYAGSMGGGTMSEASWGAVSAYGDAFGPSMATNTRRSQLLGGGRGTSNVGFPSPYQRAESAGNLSQQRLVPPSSSHNPPRPRMKTAPSSSPVPPQHRLSKVPPSSWKNG